MAHDDIRGNEITPERIQLQLNCLYMVQQLAVENNLDRELYLSVRNKTEKLLALQGPKQLRVPFKTILAIANEVPSKSKLGSDDIPHIADDIAIISELLVSDAQQRAQYMVDNSRDDLLRLLRFSS